MSKAPLTLAWKPVARSSSTPPILERCSYLTVWWKRSTTGSAPGA